MVKREEDNYFYSIAFEFLSRTKRSYFLTPIEIDLILKWKKRKIPLPVVLKGLKEGFKKSGRKKTLVYFKGFVDREYKNFSKASVGKRKSDKRKEKDNYDELLNMIDFIKDDEFKKSYKEFFSEKRGTQEREEFDKSIDDKIIERFGSEIEKYRAEWEKKFSFISIDEKTKLSLVKKYLIVKKREELGLFSVLI